MKTKWERRGEEQAQRQSRTSTASVSITDPISTAQGWTAVKAARGHSQGLYSKAVLGFLLLPQRQGYSLLTTSPCTLHPEKAAHVGSELAP